MDENNFLDDVQAALNAQALAVCKESFQAMYPLYIQKGEPTGEICSDPKCNCGGPEYEQWLVSSALN